MSSSLPKTSFASLTLAQAVSCAHTRFIGANVLVGLVDVFDCDDGKIPVITEIAESKSRTGLDANFFYCLLGQIEGNGNAEEGSIGKADVGDDTVMC